MEQVRIKYDDILTKQMVEDWADDKGFIASEEISLHLEERFDVAHILIHEAVDQGDFLSLKISTDKWSEPREFALMSTGALAW